MSLNTRIRGVQIKDADITETQLNASVNASLDLADSSLQSIAAGSITETELGWLIEGLDALILPDRSKRIKRALKRALNEIEGVEL